MTMCTRLPAQSLTGKHEEKANRKGGMQSHDPGKRQLKGTHFSRDARDRSARSPDSASAPEHRGASLRCNPDILPSFPGRHLKDTAVPTPMTEVCRGCSTLLCIQSGRTRKPILSSGHLLKSFVRIQHKIAVALMDQS